MGDDRTLYASSLDDPQAFWAEAATAVRWTREPPEVLDGAHPPFYRWYPDAELNTCANALDRHVDDGGGSACTHLGFTGQRIAAHLYLR